MAVAALAAAGCPTDLLRLLLVTGASHTRRAGAGFSC